MKAYQRKWLGTLAGIVGAALIAISVGARSVDPLLDLFIDSPSLGEHLVVFVVGSTLLAMGGYAVSGARKEMKTEY